MGGDAGVVPPRLTPACRTPRLKCAAPGCVSPNQPGFRRTRRAAPLRLFLFLRNVFLFFFFFRARPCFFLLSSSCAFSCGAALERISVSHFKAAAPPRCRTPRLKSAASGCASPISPCSGARDGRRPRRGTSKAHACMHEFNIWSSLVPGASRALSRSWLPCTPESGTYPSLSHTMDLDFMRSSESRLRISDAHFKAGRCYRWCPPPLLAPIFSK